jgi:hypothetical protein
LASLLAKLFRLPPRWQILSSVLVLTLPMGLMQSITAQNDLVVSFFLIAFAYFGIKIAEEREFAKKDIFFLAASFALGAFAKSTFYIFAFPFCVLFGIYFLKYFKWKTLYVLASVIFFFLLVNLPFLARNYCQFDSILGPQKTSPLYQPSLNDEFDFKATISNSVKNIGLHLALPNDRWNMKIDQGIVFIHNFINFPINDAKTNYLGANYTTIFVLSHDKVGNFFQVILFFFSLMIIFAKRNLVNLFVLFYLLAFVFGFLFFAFLLKWQPWQTRLDLPGFVLMAPFIAYTLSLLKWKNVDVFVSAILLITALGIVFVFDPIKPIFGENSVFLKNNSAYIYNYAVAKEVESGLNKNNIRNIGLVLGGDTPEWQYEILSQGKKFEYVYFPEVLAKTPNFDPNFKYRALIVENSFLKNPQINNLVQNKDDILETENIDDKVTLVIYRTEQSQIIMH